MGAAPPHQLIAQYRRHSGNGDGHLHVTESICRRGYEIVTIRRTTCAYGKKRIHGSRYHGDQQRHLIFFSPSQGPLVESILDSSIASAGSFVVTPTALSRQPPLTKEIGMVIGLMGVEIPHMSIDPASLRLNRHRAELARRYRLQKLLPNYSMVDSRRPMLLGVAMTTAKHISYYVSHSRTTGCVA